MNYWIGIIGMWILTDGVFSIVTVCRLKVNNGAWDQFIRIIRCLLGVILIAIGAK